MPLLFVALCCGSDADVGGAYLYQPAYCLDEVLRCPTRPYVPQPGDIMLATDGKIFWKITHNLAGTGHPHHTGVVFARPDGSTAVLESGLTTPSTLKPSTGIHTFACTNRRGGFGSASARCR